MTAGRGRPDDYFRFNPPRGLGDLDYADYMSEGTIIEITNIWLRSSKGKDSTWAAYERVKVSSTLGFHTFTHLSEKPAYEARKN